LRNIFIKICVRTSCGAYGKPEICFVFKKKNGGDEKSTARSGEDATIVEGGIQGRIKDKNRWLH
jgi:hypothetical protein